MRATGSDLRMARRVTVALGALLVAVILVTGCGSATAGRVSLPPTPRPTLGASSAGALTPTSSGMPQVRGAEIVDSSGNTLLLRGAMIPTSLAYINRWAKGQDPTQTLDAATFTAMAG